MISPRDQSALVRMSLVSLKLFVSKSNSTFSKISAVFHNDWGARKKKKVAFQVVFQPFKKNRDWKMMNM